MKLPHVIESQQFTVPLLMELFDRTRQMEKVVARGGTRDYSSRVMASLFYEPSTRTRFSFEAAMYRLGGRVHVHRARAGVLVGDRGRAARGHDPDHLRLLGRDRPAPHRGGRRARARRGSRACRSINAGDGGGGQHPTQALLDLYTIYRERRTLDGLTIAIVGELDRGRTARSLALPAEQVRAGEDLLRQPARGADAPGHPRPPRRARRLVRPRSTTSRRMAGEVDVIYQTRIRPDRVGDRAALDRYTIDERLLRRMKPDAMILHPLPRTVEIDKAVDDDPRALYFKQAANGLFIRMALLTLLWDRE
ncbi:MAG: hypothetical protein MZV49_25790 [Rhodopseudomonas palustris]|nr:hypothetical protein [Rhodopseudomonas palustris]